jgi:predicted alpha/beta hydrolase family esterase
MPTKKAVILHGTGSNHESNWFPWLQMQLELVGYEVWVPDLPGSDKPIISTYTEYLIGSKWDFNNNLIIGHSSGAVEILGLLENLSNVKVDTAIFVSVFEGDLGWNDLRGLNQKFDFKKINQNVNQSIVIQSDDDPYCPVDGAKRIAEKLSAHFVLMHKMGHFSYELDNRFNAFPEILEVINGVKDK